MLVREAVLRPTHLRRGRARPAGTRLDGAVAGDGGAGLDVGVGTDDRAGQQGGAGTDAGLAVHLDGTDTQDVTVDPVARHVDLRLDRTVVAEGEQARDGRQGMQIDAAADLHTEGARVVVHPRRTRDGLRTGGVRPPFGGPDAQVRGAAARVFTGLDAGGEQARAEPTEGQAAQRGAEDEQQHGHQPPGDMDGPRQAGEVCQVAAQEDPAEPRRGLQRHHRDLDEQLREAGTRADRADGAGFGGGGVVKRHPGLPRDGLHGLRQRPQAGMVVEIADRDGGYLFADAAHEGGGGQGGAAEGEEVGVGILDGRAQDIDPQFGQPRLGGGEVGGLDADARQRPGQRGLVDLAGGPHRQLLHDADARDKGGGHGLRETLVGGVVIETGLRVIEGDITDEHRLVRTRLLHRDSRVVHVRQGGDIRLHLTELDAAATDLHLVVDTTDEIEAVLLEADVIARPIRARPPDGRHGGVLLGVLHRVEVAGQADTADDELADLADGDRLLLGVDDDEVPARQRQADAHRLAGVQLRRGGDDGGLGGAVGVPHLAVVGGEALDELLGAGLTADDEQADVVQRLGGPQAGEGGHGGDHRDVATDEPGAQVHAGAHQGTRGGHQAGTVPPREPHLLTRRVEGDGQAGQDAVLGSEGAAGGVDQEHLGLRVDEGGRRTMGDGHALRLAGGSGGEDDPGGVVETRAMFVAACARRQHAEALVGEDAVDLPFGEDHVGAFVGVVGVDWDVGGAGGDGGEDGDVEVTGSGGHADADAVAAADTVGVQFGGQPVDFVDEFGVGEDLAVVDGGGLGVGGGGGGEDVVEGAFGGGVARAEELAGDLVKGQVLVPLGFVGFEVGDEDGLGEFAQVLELLAGRFVESGGFGVGDELGEFGLGLGALLRGGDDLAAAVLGVAFAPGPALGLEAVDEADHVGGVDGEGFGEGGLGGGVAFDEAGEDPVAAHGGAARAEGSLYFVPGAAAEAFQLEAGGFEQGGGYATRRGGIN